MGPAIPAELGFLETLANNLWWCWNSDAIELFRRIDPRLWTQTGHNPIVFLNSLPQKKLQALTNDDGFLTHLQQITDRFDAEVLHGRDGKEAVPPRDAVAYFSMEYGIHESVRLYSGGLGCLAGDHLKAASDINTPLVAVGLLYRQGYFQQYLNKDGWQQEAYPENQFHHLPIRKACHADKNQVIISIQLPEGPLKAAIWQLDVGRVPVYLLDTNIPDNPPDLRKITCHLYEGDRKCRLRQELLLGVGGFKALIALGYEPPVCHMNEGHAAFLSLARIGHLVNHLGISLPAALEIMPRTDVFTTHTPVPAGNEAFSVELLRPHLAALHADIAVDPEEVIRWGQSPNSGNGHEFQMTILGLRMAQFCNGVSRLHGVVARKMWTHLWPDKPEDEIPISHITNGVHVSSWLSPDNLALFDRYLGPGWWDNPGTDEILDRIVLIPNEELWRAHELGRSRLVRAARELGEKQYNARNATKAEVAQMRTVLRHDVLTIGFARRFAAYKRANLLLKDPARFEALLTNKDRPIQIIFAGKAHPADDVGKELIRQLVVFAHRPAVRQRIVFLEDYDIQLARYLVQGVDVWLNTPRRPQEASGTSGMKACVNGALHLSCLDGWWDEGYSPDCGWAIGHGEDYENPEYQDAVESQALYNLLENEVAPSFYDRQEGDLSSVWLEMMKMSIKTALGKFTARRMMAEYKSDFYKPASREYARLTANNAQQAKELVKQHERLRTLWSNVAVALPSSDRDVSVLHVGDSFEVSVNVNLGQLSPDEVDVEVYYGAVGPQNTIGDSNVDRMGFAEKRDDHGNYMFRHKIACRASGRHGFTVRVTPRGEDWKRNMPGFITWADGSE